ncbi:MAG: polyprenyl synthetase family protein [Gemmatimonadaceae bacterium]|nr:polyprenyl synthetase family protein [Gemmatimonadaceae bacterium]
MPASTAPDFSVARARVAQALEALCARTLPAIGSPVGDAMRYAITGEGKRLRAVLVLSAYEACGGTGDVAPLAAAVEVVHAYSLVHDDLPCMDDDDLRRGRPTVHKAFGVPVATAAGMAMVPLAARAAWVASEQLGLDAVAASEIVRVLMRASGAGGMIGGQLLDLEGEGGQLSYEQLERVHRCKTGALIEASVAIGACAARAPAPHREALGRYGRCIGLAFQIADDVLDVTATSDELGKTAGKDVAFQKSTYPALLGVDGAIARAEALVDEGCQALAEAGVLTPALEATARYIVARRS